MEFEKAENEAVSFEPFFYGRKGQRKIVYSNNHKIFDETITFEGNSFCNMLETSIEQMRETQETRFSSMYNVTLCLNRLSDEISKLR